MTRGATMEFAWTCACCGRAFATLPLDFAWSAPAAWPVESARDAKRDRLDSDFCVVGDDFFTRGVIELPVRGLDEPFRYGVWVSLSEASFRRALALFDAREVPDDEAPRFGWLSNRIPIYPDTLLLKTHVHFRSGGIRPAIELEPTDHPLAREQRDGITVQRVQEIVAALMHD